MTRPSTKTHERFHAEQAAKQLGETWTIGPNRERPDFIVSDERQQFGLEVVEVFTGAQNRSGSAMKKIEAQNRRTIDGLRREYEKHSNVPLIVKFLGPLCDEKSAAVVPALIAKDLRSKPLQHRCTIDTNAGLRVFVTRSFHPDWFSINDRVGWVDRNPLHRIAAAVEGKARKLSLYRSSAGPDVRLLVVANRLHNSGKLTLDGSVQLDCCGFNAVYFLSYPESITTFS